MSRVDQFPPPALMRRVGSLPEGFNNREGYLELGRATRAAIEELLPAPWSWDGTRTLDFGCGAGRTLRHFVAEASRGTFYGCDIDRDSIAWVRSHFVPPFEVFLVDEAPPLSLPDASLDLIYAISVFTHITIHWSSWLLELHRLLRPDGLLLVTFMGEGMGPRVSGEPWNEDQIGMTVFAPHQEWDLGGPMVLHSPWWIQEHWGRLFAIEILNPSGFGGGAPVFGTHNHGVVLMRKSAKACTREDLQRPNPDDGRELKALTYQVDRLLRWPTGREANTISGRQAARALLDAGRRRLPWPIQRASHAP